MTTGTAVLPIPVGVAPDLAATAAPNTTVGLFLRQAERFGSRTMVRFYDKEADRWTALSWSEFRERVLRVAAGLVESGIKKQDRVLLLSENRVEWLFCDLGIQAAGAVTVPVYASLQAATVQLIASDSEASLAIVSDTDQAAKLASMPRPLPVVSIASGVPQWLSGSSAFAAAEVKARLASLRPDDLATIVYTSGTSGRPKGVVVPHGTLIDELTCCSQAYDIQPDDVLLSLLPYAHVLERVATFFFGAVRQGAELNLGRGPDHFLADVQAIRPTCMDAVPRLFEKAEQQVLAQMQRRSPPVRALFTWALATGRSYVRAKPAGLLLRLRRAVADRLVLRRLRRKATGGRLRFFLSGSAPLEPEVEEFFWAMGIPIYQGWGLTETTAAVTVNTVTEHRFGTAGKPIPGVSIRLASDGEIEVRSPGLMREYHRNPEATAEAIVDGWFKTGDIGRIDRDGFLTITDRKKDLIKTSGGKYIAPQPIEVRLQQNPLIQTAVVVGDGRPFVCALIVPDWKTLLSELRLPGPIEQLIANSQVRATIQKLVDQANIGLERFETVKQFRLLPRALTLASDELTPTLKVKRRVVMERYHDLIEEMYRDAGRGMMLPRWHPPAELDLSLIDVHGRARYRLARLMLAPLARLLFRFEFLGRENIPREGRLIVAANHLNWLDIPALLLAFPAKPRINFVADARFTGASVWKSFVVRQAGGVLPLPAAAPGSGWYAIAACVEHGARVAVFPEGRFGHREGQVLPFHRGFAVAALKTEAPVIPVAIAGTRRPWLRKRIRVTIAPPISPAGHTVDSLRSATRACIEQLLPRSAPLGVTSSISIEHRPLGRMLSRLFS